jgi:hypothetical protein
MFILIIREFSRQKMPWEQVEENFASILSQAKEQYGKGGVSPDGKV